MFLHLQVAHVYPVSEMFLHLQIPKCNAPSGADPEVGQRGVLEHTLPILGTMCMEIVCGSP